MKDKNIMNEMDNLIKQRKPQFTKFQQLIEKELDDIVESVITEENES